MDGGLNMKLGLGVCARDEGSTIVDCLVSLADAADRVTKAVDWSLIVCANGCNDDTASLVGQWLQARRDSRITLRVLDEANLVEAQRAIASFHFDSNADIIGFFDADILVDRDCIKALLETMLDPEVRIAYAVSVPIKNDKVSLVQRILDQYDRDETVFSRRIHLHGRAFLTKEWRIPKTSPPLLADDIYLSCDALSRFGVGSIVKCDAAKVHFNQITRISDYYSAYRRRQLELRKCLRLDPRFSVLPRRCLNRSVDLRGLFGEAPGALMLWMAFFALRLCFSIGLFFENLIGQRTPVWRPTASSKRSFVAPVSLVDAISVRCEDASWANTGREDVAVAGIRPDASEL